MKENLEKALKNIKNLNVRNHFKTTVALLTMSSVLALTGCSGIRRANTDDIKNKAAYETEVEEETNETVEEAVEEVKEETEDEKEETKEAETEDVTEELSEFDKIDLSSYVGYKLEKALKDAGYEYSFDYRKQLAEHFGIENYKGTASQNLEILEKLGAKVTVDTNTSNKTDNKTASSVENKENQDNKNAASEVTTPITPGASSSAEDEKSHGHSGNHGNSGDKKPTAPEKPVDPDKPVNPDKPVEPSKPEHVHAFDNWHSKDDQYEEGECSCGEKELREHKYNTTIGNYTPNHNGTHSADVTDTCINCGHVVSKKDTADCNYTTIIAKDDTNETKQCACGDTIDVAHVWDEGVLDSNNNTVYTCTNPGCGYSYKVEHHIVEETKEKKSQADLCRIINGVCTIPGCGKIIYTIEDREHDFFVEQSGYGRVPDMLKCRDCDYRTEDPDFVPSKPVVPPMPDDEDEEEISTYSIDYDTEVQNSDFFVTEANSISESSVTQNSVESEIGEETEYEVITTPLEEPVDDAIYSTPDYSDDYMEIINVMEEAILPKEDEENVEEESAENVLKLSL